eukprot:PITA_25593
MEGHRNKMAVLETRINFMKQENQNLKSMLKRMISSYDDLQKQIRCQKEKQHQTRVDRSKRFSPEHQIEENFNFRVLSTGSVNVDSGDSVSHQSNESSDSDERVQEKNERNTGFMDDQQLPSNRREINSLQLDQFQNGMLDSSMDESPNKKHQALSQGGGEQTAVAPKKVVYMRTRSEASVINDGCRWRKYGQKSTRNNPRPRSYYKCAMAPDCPVKKRIQRCAEDATIVITTYEGEHTHSLNPLAMATMQAGSSNQFIGEGMNGENFVVHNQSMPFSAGCIARISTSSSCPTIILDLTDNQRNRGLQMQPAHLAASSFQHFTPSLNSMGHVLEQNQLGNYSSIIQDYVASIRADPNFSAALATAIADSMFKLGGPVQLLAQIPPCNAMHQCFNDGRMWRVVKSFTRRYS